jgi:hypothetical protein
MCISSFQPGSIIDSRNMLYSALSINSTFAAGRTSHARSRVHDDKRCSAMRFSSVRGSRLNIPTMRHHDTIPSQSKSPFFVPLHPSTSASPCPLLISYIQFSDPYHRAKAPFSDNSHIASHSAALIIDPSSHAMAIAYAQFHANLNVHSSHCRIRPCPENDRLPSVPGTPMPGLK